MSAAPQLRIAIVGAGIGGLAAAAALRKHGHDIKVFESSKFSRELGAAVGIQSNAMRVLEYLGYEKENLRLTGVLNEGTVQQITQHNSDGQTNLRFYTTPMGGWFCHRVDVHEELKRLAISPALPGPPAQLILGTPVAGSNPVEGKLTLKDGTTVEADLIIAADGIRSTLRKDVVGYTPNVPATGICMFRFFFDTDKLKGREEEFSWLHQTPVNGGHVILCPEDYYRRVFLCFCRDGTKVNVAAQFPDRHDQDKSPWSEQTTLKEMLEEYSTFHPKFHALLALADDPILRWQLRTVDLLPTWTNGRAALLGDAAHATFPTLGQGAAMALEDAATMGVLFPAGTKREDVPERLKAYQQLRKQRGELINRESLEQIIIPEKRDIYHINDEFRNGILDYDAAKVAQAYYASYISV